MTRFAVGARNILCTRMMPCTVICGLTGHTKDVYGLHQRRQFSGVDFYEFGKGTFFTSAKALHFVIEAALHWKGICIYALTLLACHFFFLHLTKLLAALFQPECAGSLSCSDHVSIGEHWSVKDNLGEW